MKDEIKKALAEATPGPWEYEPADDDRQGTKDVIIINNAPEWLRYLIGEVERLNIALYTHESYDKTVSELHEENERLRKALEELHEVSALLASRIGLSITAKRMQGKNESADLEEEKFFKPWEKAAEKSKAALQSIKGGESRD